MEKREGLGGGDTRRGARAGGRGKREETGTGSPVAMAGRAGPMPVAARGGAHREGPTENTKGEQVLVRAHLGDRAAWAFDRAFCSVPNLRHGPSLPFPFREESGTCHKRRMQLLLLRASVP